MLNGPTHYDVAQERLAGFRSAVAEKGLTIPQRNTSAVCNHLGRLRGQ